MRAEQAAALTNFLLIIVMAGLLMASSTSGGTHVYAHPTKAAFQAVAMAILVLTFVGVPLAALAAWRTRVHAERFLAGKTTGWFGVVEAGALGFAITLPFVLPGIIARQFNPGAWGQPQAFTLGVGYVGVYGLLGLVVGLLLGVVLWLAAFCVILLHRRTFR